MKYLDSMQARPRFWYTTILVLMRSTNIVYIMHFESYEYYKIQNALNYCCIFFIIRMYVSLLLFAFVQFYLNLQVMLKLPSYPPAGSGCD